VPLCSHCQQQEQIDWQAVFIRDNYLMIGYFAWIGFQQMGVGALWCDIQVPPAETNLRFHSWDFTSKFLSGQCLADYLQTLKVPSTTSLLAASEKYNPQREIMLIIQASESVEIVLIKSRIASPLVAYQSVLDRWDEFMTDCLPLIISNDQPISLPDAFHEEFNDCIKDFQLVRAKPNPQYIQFLKEWLDILVWLMSSLRYYFLKPYVNIIERILTNERYS
jgi:hypothetical protein